VFAESCKSALSQLGVLSSRRTLDELTQRPRGDKQLGRVLGRVYRRSDYKTGLAERYGGEPLSIQVRKRSTSSAGQRPSQGMLPAASFS
jgi:hypothetical protein